jgi:hypothetical protein
MKSERRHELQHNVLADWLAKAAEAVQPYQNMILAAVIVVVVAVLGYTWWSRASLAQTTQAWDELNTAIEMGNPEKLTKVIEGYPNSNVAMVATLLLADYHLGAGCNQLFVNKAMAQQELTKATEMYIAVRERGAKQPSLRERATYGLARAKEAKGDLAPAAQLYAEVVSDWPGGAFAGAAKQRLDDLNRPATRKLYDQFAHFDPKPAFTGEPGQKPSFDLNSLPSDAPPSKPSANGDIKFGDLSKGKAKEEPKKTAEPPKAAAPAPAAPAAKK